MAQEKNKVIQHFVPQCYLRKFGINKKMIYKFSKKTRKSEESQIKQCCKIDDFYTLCNRPNTLHIEEDVLDHREENVFGDILEKLRIITQDLLKGKTDKIILTSNDYDKLARGIVVQYLRGPRYRNAAIQREMKSDYANIVTLCKHIGFEIEEITFKYNESNIHGDIIESEKIINTHINYLIDSNWNFLFSNDCFITSDEPVCIEHEFIIPVLPHETLQYFNQIYYPLNSHLLLRITKSKCNTKSGLITEITKDELSRINEVLLLNSREYYFCKINNPLING